MSVPNKTGQGISEIHEHNDNSPYLTVKIGSVVSGLIVLPSKRRNTTKIALWRVEFEPEWRYIHARAGLQPKAPIDGPGEIRYKRPSALNSAAISVGIPSPPSANGAASEGASRCDR